MYFFCYYMLTAEHKDPPPDDSHKHKSKGSHSGGSHSSGSSGKSSSGSSGGSGSSSSSSSSSAKSTKPPPSKSSGFMHFGMAAVTVVGVAAFYNKHNRQITTQDVPDHSLKGALAKRMKRFDNLAGTASPQARGDGGSYSFGDDEHSQAYTCDSNIEESDSDTNYVEMSSAVSGSDSYTAGRSTMAMV